MESSGSVLGLMVTNLQEGSESGYILPRTTSANALVPVVSHH